LVVGVILIAAGVIPSRAVADPPVSRPFLRVVLLGDSYSAGNGAGTADEYYGPNGCWRSTANWAEQYVDYLRTLGYAISFENRACSGSTTEDIYSPRQDEGVVKNTTRFVHDVTGDPTLPAQLRAQGFCAENYPEEEHLDFRITNVLYDGGLDETTVRFECDRTLDPQMKAVGSDTDLVLMTTGGNDLRFGDIVRKCFLAVVRDGTECAQLFVEANNLIANGTVEDRITTALDDLRSKRGMRPGSRVVVVSYPYLEAGTGYSLGGVNVSDAIRQLGDEGDAVQQSAIAAANSAAGSNRNVFVPSVKDAFAGPPHHEPFGDFSDENPDRWIYEFDRGLPGGTIPGIACTSEGDGNIEENYHPNPCGQKAIADLLKPFGTFGISPSPIGGGDVDVVFVVDTTGSMGDDIAAVQSFATDVVNQLTQNFATYRCALVTYRDHPSWTGDLTDYPSRVDLDFTDDPAAIVSAISTIQLGDGGDTPESVYSGLKAGIGLSWRPGVKKIVLQLGDAPPHDPEPVTNYTANDVVEAALAVDPAEVFVLNVSSGGVAPPELVDIANRTGGAVFSAPSPSEVAQALTDALAQAAGKPIAVAGGPYVTRVGSSRTLDGSDSVDGDGVIVSYEWDLDGDGDFDTSSSQPTYTYTFSAPFDGAIGLRVTDDDGLTSVATAHAHASVDGDEVPAGADNCPAAPNHGQDDFDHDGIGDVCDSSPGFELEGGGATCASLSATVVGTDGPDTLSGTNGVDVIVGLGGDDTISALDGADVICGGEGDDHLIGGKGNDSLFGNEGADVLEGGDNNDGLVGGLGNDQLDGGKGDDRLGDESGQNHLDGGPGTDYCDSEGSDAGTSTWSCEIKPAK
jgi:Ca2+-binding RTX toxin-like protein/lysophospholipase L1-like esterase